MHKRHKKVTAAILSLMITLSASLPHLSVSTADAAGVPGDISLDGKAASEDLVGLKNYFWSYGQLSTEQIRNADINSDGRLDIIDYILLKDIILNGGNSNQQTGNNNSSASDYSALKINEICTTNKSGIQDSTGSTPDWIEIHNTSSSQINIGGVGLSDGSKNRYKFTFPAGTVIQGGGFIVVFCDDTDTITGNEYHAMFKLNAEGETVYLTAPSPSEGTNGNDIDVVEVPQLDEDVTYGRQKDGSDNFVYLQPTPKTSNNSAQTVYKIEAPVFDHEGGFYDSAFDLVISERSGNTILYTTDGSDPRTSSTATVYTAPVKIYDNTNSQNILSAHTDITLSRDYRAPSSNDVDKGFAIRAVCKDRNGQYGNVVTNSYFVGKSADYYKKFKVVSMTTDSKNLFDPDTGIYVIGNRYNQWRNSGEFKQLDEWSTENPTNYNQSGKEWERPANIQVFENGQAVYSTDIGIRIGGNASRNTPQKTFKLYARSEYGDSKMDYKWIDGLKDANGNKIKSFDKISLRNSANDWWDLHMRDTLNQSLITDRNIAYQGQEQCILFIDGEFWGLYEITEKLDEDYVQSHYGVDDKDVTIYKVYDGVSGSESVYNEYKTFYDWAVNADMTDNSNYQKACASVDMSSLIDYIAIETYICNGDWNGPKAINNWAMWRSNTVDQANPYSDGKWRYMLYDTEYSTGLYHEDKTRYNYDHLSNLNTEKKYENIGALFYSLMNNTTFRSQFEAAYTEIIEKNFEKNLVDNRISSIVTDIKDAVFKTNLRYSNNYSNSMYDNNLRELREFFSNRPQFAKQYLQQFNGPKTQNNNQGPQQPNNPNNPPQPQDPWNNNNQWNNNNNNQWQQNDQWNNNQWNNNNQWQQPNP